MNEFLQLNKTTLIKSYFWICGFMALGFSTYCFFFYQELELTSYIVISALSTFLFPLFTIGVWSLDWFRKRKYKNKILNNNPLSKLNKIGFTNRTIRRNHNSLVDYVQYAEINDCVLVFDINIKNPKIAEFQIYGYTDHLSSSEFTQKLKELKLHSIDLSYTGFKKLIDTKNGQVKSIQELEKTLIEFTHIVKKLKYKPISITEWESV